MAQRSLVGQGLVIIETSRSHSVIQTTLGLTPLNEWSARRRDLYLTTHNNHKWQTSIPTAEFEPAIPSSKRPQNSRFMQMSYEANSFSVTKILALFGTRRLIAPFPTDCNSTPSCARLHPVYATQPAWPIGHAGGRLLLWHYDLYQKLQLQFYVLLMMGATDTRNM